MPLVGKDLATSGPLGATIGVCKSRIQGIESGGKEIGSCRNTIVAATKDDSSDVFGNGNRHSNSLCDVDSI